MSRTKDRIKLENYAMPTVSGDPIIESGSNSDGEFTKFADGTLICKRFDSTSTAVSSTTASGGMFFVDTGLTLPVVFAAMPAVSNASRSGGSVCFTEVGTATTSSVNLRTQTLNSTASQAMFFGFIAVGRWF